MLSKIEPLLGEIRSAFAPQFAVNLEKLIDATPDGRNQTAKARERMKAIRDRIAAKQAKTAQQVGPEDWEATFQANWNTSEQRLGRQTSAILKHPSGTESSSGELPYP